MARLRFLRLNCRSDELVFLVCAFLVLEPLTGQERQNALEIETVLFNVLGRSKLRPNSSGRAFEEKAASDVVNQNVSHTTALAKIVHRNSLSSSVQQINTSRQELMIETILRDEARFSSIQKQINRLVSGELKGIHKVHVEQHEKKTPAQDFESPIFSGLAFGTGEYFAVVGVGTPRRDMYLVVDTGSDITWLQCSPCTNCYKQKDALFNPSSSSTFKVLDCSSSLCLNLDVMGCLSNRCLYQADYGDGSFTMGELVTDNVVLDAAFGPGQVVLSNIPLGCGHDNEGTFGTAAGILGLGRGPLSFPNNLDSSTRNIFSYCLPDRESDPNHRSTLVFGDAAIPHTSTGNVKFIPQLRNPRVATYYYVQITGISVGGNLLTNIPASAFQLDLHGNGGTIFDSGTTITRLEARAYTAVRDAFRAATMHLTPASDFKIFDTCYDLTGINSISVPTVTFHFQGDVDMRLPPSNYIVPVSNNNIYCFAFAASAGPSVIGNVQQQSFRVIYDNVHKQIGLLSEQCS